MKHPGRRLSKSLCLSKASASSPQAPGRAITGCHSGIQPAEWHSDNQPTVGIGQYLFSMGNDADDTMWIKIYDFTQIA